MEYFNLYKNCNLCPRKCSTDRTVGKTGFCKAGAKIKIAFAGLHKGEEPVISGDKGSGTIFFSGCTLKCSFCQNYQISSCSMGTEVQNEIFAEICLKLKKRGAANINLVTGTHFIPDIHEALKIAEQRGIDLPIVWNTSSYETADTIDILNDFVDIYLADIKTLESSVSGDLFNAADYPDHAITAVEKMIESKPLVFEDDLMKQGVIIRHLVLPGKMDLTEEFLKLYSAKFSDRGILSLMVQYIPPEVLGKNKNTKAPDKYLSEKEYDELLELLDKYNIEDGFLQDLEESSEWVPDFNRINPFPENLAEPVWTWNKGFIIQDL